MDDIAIERADLGLPRPDWPAEFVRWTPPPALVGLVIDMTGYRERAPCRIRQVESASLVVPLIFSFDEPFEIGLGREPGRQDRMPSFVAGLFGGPVLINSNGRSHCLQINFTPLGAHRFFGLPMREVADRMVPVADIDDRAVAELGARVEEAPDWPARFALAERFMVRRLGRSAPLSGAGRAFASLLRSGGGARVATLAGELEWSRKHLASRFRDEIGLAPKAVARIVRFNRAQRLALRAAAVDWADIAVDAGYADQAHLIREFREFAGATPAGWLAAQPRA
ncbi:MAG: helix-turn-helix domain-containing protein [Azospirillaceae bacterium]